MSAQLTVASGFCQEKSCHRLAAVAPLVAFHVKQSANARAALAARAPPQGRAFARPWGGRSPAHAPATPPREARAVGGESRDAPARDAPPRRPSPWSPSRDAPARDAPPLCRSGPVLA